MLRLNWQSQHAAHLAECVRNDVVDTYGEIAVSKVAHSEYLRQKLGIVTGTLPAAGGDTKVPRERKLSAGRGIR